MIANKKLVYALGLCFTSASFFFLSVLFIQNYEKFSIATFKLSDLFVFFLGIVVALIGNFILAFSWFLLIRNHNCNFRIVDSFVVIGLSQLSKYIPGNFAHLLGRLVLASRWFETSIIVKTLFVESALLIFSASLLAVSSPDFFRFLKEYIPWILSQYLLLVLLVFGIGIAMIIRNNYIKDILQIRNFFYIVILYNMSFVFFGALIYLLFASVFYVETISLWQCICGFALAFLAGYLLPGAPGGIGVRESVFILLFSTSGVHESISLQVIMICRLLTIIADVFLFLIAYPIRKRSFAHGLE